MATADEYAAWIVKNQSLKGTADFDTVARAYEEAKTAEAQPKYGADLIPGQRVQAPAPTAPAEKKAPSILGTALTRPLDVLELPVSMGAQAVMALPTEAAKLYGTLTSGKFGTQEGVRAGEAAGREFQKQYVYQPRSEFAQYYGPAIGQALESTGLQGVPIPVMEGLAMTAGPAARVVGQNVKNVLTAPLPFGETVAQQTARQTAERSAQSWQRAPKIDAAKLAQQYSIALNPAESNPTPANQLKATLAYSAGLDARLAAHNEQQWVGAVRKDLGLPTTGPMSVLNDATYEKLKTSKQVTEPYQAVRQMGEMRATPQIMQDLDRLQATTLVGDTTGVAQKANEHLARIKQQIEAGVNGNVLMDSIQQLRQEASSIYGAQKAGNPITPEQRQLAAMNLGVANALEDMIAANMPNARALGDFQRARTTLAKINDHEMATNTLTGQVDPRVYADLIKDGRPLTGVARDLATIAENFPSTSRIGATGAAPVEPWTRSNMPGTAGAGAAAAAGVNPIFGGLLGSTVGRVASGIGTKRMVTPEYQAAHAMPPDYRVYPPTPNLPAVFDPRNAVVPPAAPGPQPYTPNWVYGRPEAQVTPGVAPQVNLLAPPSAESTLNALRAEDVRRAGVSRALGQEAEARSAAAEAATRQPARGGVEYTFDAAGNLVPVQPSGAGGLMPTSLESAVQKLSGQVIAQPSTTYKTMTISPKSGAQPYTRIIKKEGETTFERGVPRAFDLTAEERIAWNKAKAELEMIEPGLAKLDDYAIVNKMQNRQWAEDAIVKARQQERAFADIAARAADERARQAAMAKREQMLDLLDTLEAQFAKPRPTSGGGQGPKTRAAIRNQLLGGEKKNNLAP